MLVKTESIVLKSTSYRENDKILTLFSYGEGKLQAVAKNCKKPSSSLMASTQMFAYSNFLLYKGSKMYNVSQGEMRESFYNLRINLESFTYGSYICQLLDSILQEGQPNKQLFVLTLKTLKILSQIDKNQSLVVRAYELKLVTLLGYQPHLTSCVTCGNKELNDIKFNSSLGGVICQDCLNVEPKGIRLSLADLDFLKHLLVNPIGGYEDVEIDEKTEKKLEKIMENYLKIHVERSCTALEFINKLKNAY
jgi:DNA repair protein RecO (recombination protein O)